MDCLTITLVGTNRYWAGIYLNNIYEYHDSFRIPNTFCMNYIIKTFFS